MGEITTTGMAGLPRGVWGQRPAPKAEVAPPPKAPADVYVPAARPATRPHDAQGKQDPYKDAFRAGWKALREDRPGDAARFFTDAAEAARSFEQAVVVMRAAGDAHRDRHKQGEDAKLIAPLVSASVKAMRQAEKFMKTAEQALELAAYHRANGSIGIESYYAQAAESLFRKNPGLADVPENYGVDAALQDAMRYGRDGHPVGLFKFDLAVDMCKNPAAARHVAVAAMVTALAVRAGDEPASPQARAERDARVVKLEAVADRAFHAAGRMSRGYDELSATIRLASAAGRKDAVEALLKRVP